MQLTNMFQSSVLKCKLRVDASSSLNSMLDSRNNDGFVYVKTTVSSIAKAAVTSALSSLMEAFVPKVMTTDKDSISFVDLEAVAGWDLE